jgi:hypothetical protein
MQSALGRIQSRNAATALSLTEDEMKNENQKYCPRNNDYASVPIIIAVSMFG